MPTERAIDKLKKAFSVEERSKYSVLNGEDLVLEIYWTPLTIADRDQINNTLKAMSKSDTDNTMDFALQVIIEKAQDSEGKKLFTQPDAVVLKREIPLSVLVDIMSKMQDIGEEAEPTAVKSAA